MIVRALLLAFAACVAVASFSLFRDGTWVGGVFVAVIALSVAAKAVDG